MKRTVMFYMSYIGNGKEGHRICTVTFSIFKRKSSIVQELYNWQVEQIELVFKEVNEPVYVSSLKIIGL